MEETLRIARALADGTRLRAIDILQRGAKPNDVGVRVMKPRNDRGAANVDHAGRCPLERENLSLFADSRDSIRSNGHRLGDGVARVYGVDGGVVKN